MDRRLALASLLPLVACQPGPNSDGASAPPTLVAGEDGAIADDPERLGEAAFDPERAEAVLDAQWFGDVLVSRDAVVLDDEPGFLGFQAPAGSSLVAVDFDGPAAWSELRAGAVVVSGRTGGLLRRVEDVSFEGNRAILATSPAQLTDVLFVANHFERLDLPLLPADLGAEGRDPFTRDFGGLTLLSAGSAGNRVAVDVPMGWVKLDPGLDWGIDIDWFDFDRPWPKVNKADLTVLVGAEFEALLHAAAEGSFDQDGEHDLLEFTKDFDFRVGPVPVAGSVLFDVDVVWEAAGSAGVDGTIGAWVEADLALGGRYDGDWHNASGFDWQAERRGPTLQASGDLNGRLSLRIRAEVSMYSAVTADLLADPWVDGEAELACGAVDWRIDAGVSLDSSVGFDVLGLSQSKDFPTVAYAREPLAEGTLAVYDAAGLDPANCSDGEEPPEDSTVVEDEGPAIGGDDTWTQDEEEREQGLVREACADGSDDDGDGLTDCDDSECADRIVCGSQCHVWDQLVCGQTVTADSGGVYSDRKSLVNGWPINVGDYSGPEVGFLFKPPTTGPVAFELVDATPTEIDHDVMVLHSPTGVCDPADAVAWGGTGAVADLVAGENYIVVIDGYEGDAGEFTLKVNCEP